MSAFTLHNKLSGKGKFSLKGFPIDRMPESGIIPMPVALEESIGSEMGLFLIDKTPFIHDLAKARPFNLQLKPGVAQTEHGPVMFLLFYVPSPQGLAEPLLAIDYHVDPFNREMVQPWRDLSRQTHWHLILVDRRGEEVGLFEFINNFQLGERLDSIAGACRGMPHSNFALAKTEFCETYSLADLFQMEQA